MTSQAKIIAAHLLKLNVSAAFTDQCIHHGSTVADIDAIVLTMLNALPVVPGQSEFSLLLAIIFGLPQGRSMVVEPRVELTGRHSLENLKVAQHPLAGRRCVAPSLVPIVHHGNSRCRHRGGGRPSSQPGWVRSDS